MYDFNPKGLAFVLWCGLVFIGLGVIALAAGSVVGGMWLIAHTRFVG